MKSNYTSISEYTINELSQDAGREKPAKDYHVIISSEITPNDKIARPSRADIFTIFLITSGEFTIQSNLLEYTVEKNSLFIIPPGIVHSVGVQKSQFEGIVLQFTKDFLSTAELSKKHIDAFSFFSSHSNPHLLLNIEEVGILKKILLFLREKDLHGEMHPFRHEVIHHAFNLFMFEMAALFKKYRENEMVKMTRKEELLMNFVKLLSANFKEERSVQFYADHLFVTPKHLSKTVKEITARTAGVFIDEMVVTEAKILLDDSLLSIGNVADALHFSDQFFFSKFFKNHTGINPSDYKTRMP